MSEAAEPAARRGRPGYDQATVLRRAIEVFNRQGYDGTSMGDLAAELGLSKSAIYHHVPSKSHLLEQALHEALDELTTLVETAVDESTGTAYERLREVVRESVRVLVAHQDAVTLLLRVRGNSPAEQAALAQRRWIDARLAELVAAAVDEGALRADVAPDLVSRLLFGMVNSLVEWYRPEGDVDADVLARAITTIAFDGLAAEAT
ncbi:TetR/AcrR family transcriptional regulator [Nocardioides sp. cx-169]|uniref:TetR/AcrR family transcriptional regulator n=1 Tax=Nocardioides sp. cx-169 TaxID=2899080 RepID=UPI001E3B7424|nr:TetR/AcrR family transcriptional regulator [Nocardioides sp. cx-169]MCD4536564.1 TetR/AcrR family transcriptional regulator [Nocardioides sp. cx-169]